jgi:ubiquinol-cytochrome c reductase cytochrome b subunit
MSWLRRAWGFTDDRLGLSRNVRPILEHPVPRSSNWWYVFGSATLVAFIVQIITGVALAFAYVPAPNSAYDSLQFITHDAVLGNVVRGIHYWGASAMVVLIFIHTCRTFLMGAFKYPREFNWLTGVLLLFLTLGMAFTGQLLRWDQDAYWAVVVAAEQAGRTPFIGSWLAHLVVAGGTVGGATLTRFYATHVFLLPAMMFGLIGVHLYLLIRHGISDPPVPGRLVDPRSETQRYHALIEREGVPFWPDAAWRDVVFALAVGSVVLALALVLGPKELGALADPTNVNASPRPDWYFLWLFALLALIPPSLENYFIIGLPLLTIVALLIVPFITNKGERSARRRPWAPAIVAVSTVAIAVLIWEGDRAPWSPDLSAQALPVSVTQSLPPAQQAGAQLFADKGCIHCHTIAGTGGRRGPNLSTVGQRLSTDELTTRILNGGHNLPAYGRSLTPVELSQLVEFLASRQQGGGP